MFNCSASFTVAILTITTSINYYLFDLFKFIGLFNHIIRLQFIQEQSRQTLLPGLKLFYECSRFPAGVDVYKRQGGGIAHISRITGLRQHAQTHLRRSVAHDDQLVFLKLVHLGYAHKLGGGIHLNEMCIRDRG